MKQDELQLCKEWCKRKHAPTNFERSNLKKCLKKDEYFKNDVMICRYCGDGPLNVIVDWVMCDGCNCWVHQQCDSQNNCSATLVYEEMKEKLKERLNATKFWKKSVD